MGYEIEEAMGCPVEELTDQVLLYAWKKRYQGMADAQEDNMKRYEVERKHAKLTACIYGMITCITIAVVLLVVLFNAAMTISGQGYGRMPFYFLAEGLIATGPFGLIAAVLLIFSLIQCVINIPGMLGLRRSRLMDDLDMSLMDKLPEETLALLQKNLIFYEKVEIISKDYLYAARTEIARIENRVQELLEIEREESEQLEAERSEVQMFGDRDRIDWESLQNEPGIIQYEQPKPVRDEEVLGGAGMEQPDPYGMHIDLNR